MHSINTVNLSDYINEVSLHSREAYEIQEKIGFTFLEESFNISTSWQLQKILQIRNPMFEHEFNDKAKEFQTTSSYPEHWETRLGFLATIKEKMIERVAVEGLEVKMCPYNYLGYNIAGVHISQHADVCLNEAKGKIVAGDELILIIFQFMLGKRKIVAMHDPKTLLAPTPKFDSHICEERPDVKEKESMRYIKSLVYLYEFSNGNMDPVLRPRHCCPIAAMIFKHTPSYESLNLSGGEQINMFPNSYQSPLSLLKPVSQHNQPSPWSRQFPPSEFKKSSMFLSKGAEEGLTLEKELYDIEKPTSVDDTWRSSNYGSFNEGPRDLPYSLSKGLSRNGDTISGRDRSPDRNKKWLDSSHSRFSSRSSESSRKGSSRTSKH